MSPTPTSPLPVDTLVERPHALAAAPPPSDVAPLTRTYLVDSIGVGLTGEITPQNGALLDVAAVAKTVEGIDRMGDISEPWAMLGADLNVGGAS